MIIEVFASVAVNISLPSIANELGIQGFKITWLINIYIIASALIIPIAGYLVSCYGLRRVLIISLLGFMISSIACGFAHNFKTLLLLRGLQGIFGGGLIPISQAILRDSFSKDKLSYALTIWNSGIMGSAVLGPLAGGYLNDKAGWQWIFYINIPLCVLAILFCSYFIKKTTEITKKIDWFNLGLILLCLACCQALIQPYNEVYSGKTNFLIPLCIFLGIIAVICCLKDRFSKSHIINIAVFRDLNFLVCTLLYLIYSGTLFPTFTLQPILLQKIMHYTAKEAGLIVTIRGLVCTICILLAPLFVHRFKAYTLLIYGLLCTAYASYSMSQVTLDINFYKLALIEIFQGIGIAIFTVTLSIQAYKYTRTQDSHEAASIYTYARALGVSLGLSIMSAILSFSKPLESPLNMYQGKSFQLQEMSIILKQYSLLSIAVLMLVFAILVIKIKKPYKNIL